MSTPRYRDLSQPGDDVLLVLPQILYAVFDGATDTAGVLIDGESPGRMAARQAALAMLRYASAPHGSPASAGDLMVLMNESIASALAGAGSVRAGTTVALVEDVGDQFRFLIVGDSGIRINGTELLRIHKDIDLIYAAGRQALLRLLQARGWSGDALEQQARHLIFKGFAAAGPQVLSAQDTQDLLVQAQAVCESRLQPDAVPEVPRLLLAGIAGGQYGYCNRAGHSLGYAVLDGTHTQGPDVLSLSRPKREVRSLELFTDGYLSCPAGSTVRDWEDEFARVEGVDFHKCGAFAGVKGSTSTLFSDDRTVLTVHFY
ncbi:MAG: hypothetical protein FGM55_11345 [Rhodoferax sp.]|nr:hypothetical protein [Rhodoferax sp.]